jgi:hypothetical protein
MPRALSCRRLALPPPQMAVRVLVAAVMECDAAATATVLAVHPAHGDCCENARVGPVCLDDKTSPLVAFVAFGRFI